MNEEQVRQIVDEMVEGWNEQSHPRDKNGRFAPGEGRDSKGRSQKNRDAEGKLRKAGFDIKGRIRLGKDEQGPNSAQGWKDQRSTSQIMRDIESKWERDHRKKGKKG